MHKSYFGTFANPIFVFFGKGCISRWLEENSVVSIHKKESKNLSRNYRPISLLPFFSKVFERIIFNSLLNYFFVNKLFIERQSGFLTGDSCISQLLSITHKIYKSFDCYPSVDVRGTFLDISKVFDKVWNDGLIYKPKSYGVENKLLNLIQNYLTNRQQRILLSGWTSKWINILAREPQGSVLGLLLSDGLKSICKIFEDDASLFSKVNDLDTSNTDINNDSIKTSR